MACGWLQIAKDGLGNIAVVRTTGLVSDRFPLRCIDLCLITRLLPIAILTLFAIGLSANAQQPAPAAGMAFIPGATFEMGTDAADIPKLKQKFSIKRATLFEEEVPKHRLTIGAFYLDRTEVTNEQFKRFIDGHREWQKDKIFNAYHNGKYLQHWSNNDFPAGQQKYPVTFVS